MSLCDELYEISEEALKQQNQMKHNPKQEKVSEYLTEKLKEVAARGEKECVIFLGRSINELYSLDLIDVVNFASENEINYSYPEGLNVMCVTLSWDKK